MAEAIQSLLQESSSRCRPWQLAAAVAAGVLCGLIPKLTLAFCLVGFACFILPIHVPLAAVVCIATSFAVTSLQPLVGKLGIWSLTQPLLRDFWFAVDSLPLLPWLGLHNSVIHGSLLLGSLLFIPVFLLSLPIAKRVAPRSLCGDIALKDGDFEHEIRPTISLLPALEYVQITEKTKVSEATTEEASCAASSSIVDDGFETDEETILQLQNLLADCNGAVATDMTTDSVVQRAAQMVEYVDDLLAAGLECSIQMEREPSKLSAHCGELRCEEETQISIFRRSDAVQPLGPQTEAHERPGMHAIQFREAPQAMATSSPALKSELQKPQPGEPGATTLSHDAHSTPRPRVIINGVQQEEALRYLLHHLKALQEKV